MLGLVQGTADAGWEQGERQGLVVAGVLWGEVAEGWRVIRGMAGQAVGVEQE